MSASQLQQEFSLLVQQYIETHRCRGIDASGHKREFIPRNALARFWDREKILNVLCDSGTSMDERIAQDSKLILEKFLIIFSILVSIRRPECISLFTEVQLDDVKLPFDSPPELWTEDVAKLEVLDEFKKSQWKFCPLSFHDKRFKAKIPRDQIIPVLDKEPLDPLADEKDDVLLFKATIHPDCSGPLPVSISTDLFFTYPQVLMPPRPLLYSKSTVSSKTTPGRYTIMKSAYIPV